MHRLSQMLPGSRGVIRNIAGGDAVCQRLMEMGFLTGDSVEVVAIAPWGDPMDIRLGNYCLSLRKSEAERIEVETLVP